jgi:hypothetical protein
MIKIIKQSIPVILALSFASLPLAAHAFNNNQIDSVSLTHSGGNLSTTLTWEDGFPGVQGAAMSLFGSDYHILAVRVYGLDSPASGGVSPSFPSAQSWDLLDNQGAGSTTVSLTQSSAAANLTLSPNRPHISACWQIRKSDLSTVYACSNSIPNPTIGTISTQPVLSLSGPSVNTTLGTWTAGAVTHLLYACTSSVPPQTSVQSVLNMLTSVYGCRELQSQGGMPSNLASANVPSLGMVPYNRATHGSNIVLLSRVSANSQFVWTASVAYGGDSGSASSNESTPAPAKYSGPEFSGLSAKPVAVGSSSVLEGKRLNEVSSITIGGKSATFTATATELKLDVPKDLAPGLYDLVINSSAGKLTQINAVRVQGPRTALSVTTVSEGRISSEQLHEHALIAAMQQPELTKARCIVNGPNLAQAKAQAERLCALVKASNKNIETTVVESRSTVKNNSVFARVIYGWN